MDAEKVGVAAHILGGGRNRAEDAIDHAVGVIVRAKPGERVAPADSVFEVHYGDAAKLIEALPLLAGAFTIGDAPPAEGPIILEEIA